MKTVNFPMKAKWYQAIKEGAKLCELRAASSHWLTRLQGATHCSFTLGFSTVVLPTGLLTNLPQWGNGEFD